MPKTATPPTQIQPVKKALAKPAKTSPGKREVTPRPKDGAKK